MNNKGYMLVEIILASALAFGIAYFILDLIIGMKNKNDDLLVETMVNTDRVIITNKLMDYAIDETEDFDCSKLVISDKNVSYKNENIDIVNDYADIGELSCKNEFGKITINIPLTVKQMPESDFDINLDYKYKIGDMIPPSCSLTVTGSQVVATYSDNDGGSGIDYYGFNSGYTGDNTNSLSISSVGNYTYYVKDRAGNTSSCSIDVNNASVSYTCKKSYDKCQDGYSWNGSSCYTSWCNRSGYTWSCTGASFGTGRNYSSCNGDTTYSSSRCSAKVWTCCSSGSDSKPLTQCSTGTNRNGACYQDNQTSCNNGFSVDSTNYVCPIGYTKTSDNLYCYK